jgi:uncharacterized protein YjbJ (UPF0337 family)
MTFILREFGTVQIKPPIKVSVRHNPCFLSITAEGLINSEITMNRSDEFDLSSTHQPLDRQSTPKKSQLSKRLQSILRDKRGNHLSEQTPEELAQEHREGLRDNPLHEHSVPTESQVKAIWQQQIGKAKMVSGRLTEDELLKNPSQIDRLAGLVQERYAIPRAEADKQVAAFLRRRHS